MIILIREFILRLELSTFKSIQDSNISFSVDIFSKCLILFKQRIALTEDSISAVNDWPIISTFISRWFPNVVPVFLSTLVRQAERNKLLLNTY